LSRVLDIAAVLLLAGGGVYLSVDRTPVVAFPAIGIETDEHGGQHIVVDRDALDHAFGAAGLPAPPDLNGADPEPVRVLMEQARAWVSTGDVQALGRLGQVYQALEEHAAALGCFAAAAALDPGQVLWTYGLGAQCQAMALHDAAIEALDRAAAMDPDYPTTWARLGTLHLERGDLDEAQRCFEAYERLEPVTALGLIGQGRVALARGDAGSAERVLLRAVDRSPDDYMVHRLLGRVFAAQGRAEPARRQQQVADRLPQYAGWLQFDRRLSEAHALADTQRHLNNMLRVAAAKGDWPLCLSIAGELARRRPDDWNMLTNLSRIYRQLGRLDDAEDAIGKALALDPGNADLEVARAEIAFKREDYQSTMRIIDRALELDPDHAGALELLSRTLHLMGRSDEAIATARRTIEVEPQRSSAWLVLALVQSESGRRADAVATLRGLLDRDPANTQARSMLGRLTGG